MQQAKNVNRNAEEQARPVQSVLTLCIAYQLVSTIQFGHSIDDTPDERLGLLVRLVSCKNLAMQGIADGFDRVQMSARLDGVNGDMAGINEAIRQKQQQLDAFEERKAAIDQQACMPMPGLLHVSCAGPIMLFHPVLQLTAPIR